MAEDCLLRGQVRARPYGEPGGKGRLQRTGAEVFENLKAAVEGPPAVLSTRDQVNY